MGIPVTTPKTKLMAKMRGCVPLFAVGAQCDRLENDDQQCKAHGELGKKVMECDGKGKMQPVDQLGSHARLLAKGEKRGIKAAA
jgi:hypothetical protein